MTAYKLVFVPSYFTKCCTSVGTSTFGMRHSADVQIYQAATRDGRHSMEHLRKQVKVDTYVMIKLTCWLTSCVFYNKSDIQLFVNELVIYDHFNLKSLGLVIITARQRSCGKVMFSCVCLSVHWKGVPSDHYPWCIGPHCTGRSPLHPWTSDLGPT